MRNFLTFILSFGFAVFAQHIDNSAADYANDWGAKTPAEPVTNTDSSTNETKEPARTSPIYFGESSEEELTLNPNAKPRTYRMGFSLALDLFSENHVANMGVEQGDYFCDHYGIDGGIFFSFDIYPQLEFLTGFNFLFHHGHADLDQPYHGDSYYYDEIDYFKYILEFPAEFRYFLPLEKWNVRPFASLVTHIRKPIYEYYSDDSEFETIDILIDWDFMEYLGIGVELNRRFFVQYQLLLVSLRTNDFKVFGVYDAGINTWRLTLGYMW